MVDPLLQNEGGTLTLLNKLVLIPTNQTIKQPANQLINQPTDHLSAIREDKDEVGSSWCVRGKGEYGVYLEKGGGGGAVFGLFHQTLGHKVVEKKRPEEKQKTGSESFSEKKTNGFLLRVK